jgi:hypothetical protein
MRLLFVRFLSGLRQNLMRSTLENLILCVKLGPLSTARLRQETVKLASDSCVWQPLRLTSLKRK